MRALRTFLEAFGRQLATEIWKSLLGTALIAALLTLIERHAQRQFMLEITRQLKALGDLK